MDDSAPLHRLVKRWERRVELTPEDKNSLLALPSTRRTFSRDAYLVREAEPTESCQLLLSGFAYRQKLVATGARQIISIHIAGEFIDLQHLLLPVADHNVQSLGRSEVAVVPKAALLDVVTANPRLNRALWLDTLVDASIFREWIVNVGRRDAKTRIAHLLCEISLRLRSADLCGECPCAFPFTQEQIADATGLTVVHTNRMLQVLRREGLVSLSGGVLQVLDWGGLAIIGDFSEHYLHHGAWNHRAA